MDLPTFSDAAETAQQSVQAAQSHGRNLIPWLPDPPVCTCGALMYADTAFDPRWVEYVPSWECRECGTQRYREEPFEVGVEPPRRGASKLQEVFSE